MKCNVGGLDRGVRLAIAAAVVAFALFAPLGTGWRIVALIGASIAAMTALLRYCPFNALIGVNTCSQRSMSRAHEERP